MKLKVDFFSTLEQARELARNQSITDLAVRCTCNAANADTELRMMRMLVEAPRDKLRIELPSFSAELVGSLCEKPHQRRLELVDNTQLLKTSYVFQSGTLIVTAEIPGGRKKVMGCDSTPKVWDAIFDAMERGLASIKSLPPKVTIKTRPPATKRAHKDRLAKIAKRFGATLA